MYCLRQPLCLNRVTKWHARVAHFPIQVRNGKDKEWLINKFPSTLQRLPYLLVPILLILLPLYFLLPQNTIPHLPTVPLLPLFRRGQSSTAVGGAGGGWWERATGWPRFSQYNGLPHHRWYCCKSKAWVDWIVSICDSTTSVDGIFRCLRYVVPQPFATKRWDYEHNCPVNWHNETVNEWIYLISDFLPFLLPLCNVIAFDPQRKQRGKCLVIN